MYHLTKEESDRIRIIKFIAIILVVYLHSYTAEVNFSDGTDIVYFPVWLRIFEEGMSQIISRCGVPIFFLISAILFFKSDQSYGNVIRKKAKTLLLPYFIWNTFWIAVFIILQSLPFTTVYFSGNNTPILQCSLTQWFGLYGIGQEYPHCYPLWFVRDLMVVTLFFPVIKAAVNRCPQIMLGLGIILTIIPLDFYGKTALSWFIIGAAVVKMQIHITVFDHISMLKISAVYFLGIVISLLINMVFLRNIFILVGIIFWIRLTKEIYHNENIRINLLRLSEYTFIIYVLHELTLSSVQKVCIRLFPTSPVWLFSEYVLISVFVITGCMAAGIIFRKLMPRLYMLSTGGR